jgi:hypothetical protein
VEKPQKGKGIAAKDVLTVHYWQVNKRPAGWVGPGGQYNSLHFGQRARFFLRKTEQGWFDLLVPNGWDPLAKEKAP